MKERMSGARLIRNYRVTDPVKREERVKCKISILSVSGCVVCRYREQASGTTNWRMFGRIEELSPKCVWFEVLVGHSSCIEVLVRNLGQIRR